MIKELDGVRIKVHTLGIPIGSIGVVVFCYKAGNAYIVEFPELKIVASFVEQELEKV